MHRLKDSDIYFEQINLDTELGIWIFKLDTGEAFWNDSMYEIYEVDKSEFIPSVDNWEKLFHEDHLDVLDQALIYKGHDFNSFKERFRIKTKSGIKWILGVGKVYFNENGEVTKVQGTNQDITEFIVTEENLKIQNERLLNSQQVAKFGYWHWDIENNVGEWSDGMYNIYGLDKSKGKISPDDRVKFIHPEDYDRFMQFVDKSLENSSGYDITYRIYRHDDNKLRWIHSRANVKLGKNNKVIALEGVAQDITEFKDVELKLKNSEKNLLQSQEVANVGHWMWNIETGESSWSKQMFSIHGRDEKVGIPKDFEEWLETIHQDDRKFIQNAVDLTFQNKIKYNVYYKILREDNQELRWINAKGRVLRNENNEPILFSGTAQDITEFKKLEIELRDREQRLEEVQKLAKVGSWSVDMENEQVYWSDELYDIFEYDKSKEPSTEYVASILHPDDKDYFNREIEELFKGKPFIELKYRIITKGGNLKYIYALSSGIKNDDGKIVKIVGSAQDITELKTAEINLEEAQRIAKTGHWVWNPQNGDLFWSNELRDIFDIDKSFQVSYDYLIEKVVNNQKDKVVNKIQQALNNEVEYNIDMDIITEKGNHKSINVIGEVEYDETKKAILMKGIATDITERKKNELESIQKEQQLIDVQELAKIGSWTYDVKEKITTWSDQMYSILEYDESVNPEPYLFEKIVHPSERKAFNVAFQRLLLGKQNPEYYYRIITKNGNLKYIFSRAKCIFNEKGELTSLVGSIHDITNLKTAENNLIEAQRIGNTGHWIWNLIQDEVTWSPQFNKIFGFTKNVKPSYELFINSVVLEQRSEIKLLIENSIKNDEKLSFETVINDTKGNQKNVAIRGEIYRNEKDEAIQIKGILSDITQRKRNEKELAEQKEFLETIFDIFPGVTYVYEILGEELIMRKWNKNMNKILGYPDESLKEVHPDFFFDDYNKEIVENALKEFFGNKEEIEVEAEIKHYNGQNIPYKFTAKLVEFQDRKYLIGQGIDLSENKAYENEILESKDKYKHLYFNTPVMMHSIDSQGKLISVTRTWLEKMEYTEEEVIDRPSTDFLTEESAQYAKENILPNFWETGVVRKAPYTFVSKSGKEIEVELSAIAESDSEGNVTRSLAVLEDVTDRNKALNELQKSERNLSTIIENTTNFVFSVNRNYELIILNSATKNYFLENEKNEISSGMNIIECLNNINEQESFKNRLNKSLSGERVLYEWDKFQNGKRIYYETYLNPIPYRDEIVGVSVLTTDVTEQKLRSDEISKISKLESLGVLAGGIAHNFKNILTAITISIDIIKVRPELLESNLERISKSLNQANALATRFQTFSTSDEPNIEPIEISEVINEAAEISLSGSNFRIETTDLRTEKALANIDSKQINEVFINLFLNATHAMEEDYLIYVSIENISIDDNNLYNLASGNYLKIQVRDTGTGISAENLGKLFTPFFTTKQDGNGLGLSSAFFIISKHNGYITVDSELGVGTTFSMYLPTINQSKSIENSKLKIEEEKTIRAILIDDDEFIVESIVELANLSDDVNMSGFSNPFEAFEFIEKNPEQDVALIDMTLVGYSIDGLDILQRVKEINPDIKCVVFSGHSKKPVVANFREYGFDGRLNKPCSYDELEETLHRVSS
jgi:PAS domain S-box-containing protein